MRLEITTKESKRELPCPDNAIFVGIVSDIMRVCNTLDLFLDNAYQIKEELLFPNGEKAELLICCTNDKTLQEEINNYEGLKILDLTYYGMQIIATI